MDLDVLIEDEYLEIRQDSLAVGDIPWPVPRMIIQGYQHIDIENLDKTLAIILDPKGAPYTNQDVRKGVADANVLEEINICCNVLKYSHIWEITFLSPNDKILLLGVGNIRVKGRRGWLWDPAIQCVTLYLHWLSKMSRDERIRDAFRSFGVVTKIIRPSEDNTAFKVILELFKGVELHDIPYTVDVGSFPTLVELEGRPYFCSRCQQPGHIRFNCRGKACSELALDQSTFCYTSTPGSSLLNIPRDKQSTSYMTSNRKRNIPSETPAVDLQSHVSNLTPIKSTRVPASTKRIRKESKTSGKIITSSRTRSEISHSGKHSEKNRDSQSFAVPTQPAKHARVAESSFETKQGDQIGSSRESVNSSQSTIGPVLLSEKTSTLSTSDAGFDSLSGPSWNDDEVLTQAGISEKAKDGDAGKSLENEEYVIDDSVTGSPATEETSTLTDVNIKVEEQDQLN